MLRVIINADDFGKNHEVNVAVEDQIKKGNITSTTIMANADGFEEAVVLSKKYPQISYGVHLVLDEYIPVTLQKAFIEHGIVDVETGEFVKEKIWHVEIDNSLKSAIYKEWNAQIKKIVNQGVVLSHIDSHHHIHTIPALQDVLLETMSNNQLTKVRGCEYVTLFKFVHGWKHFNKSNFFKEGAYLLIRNHRFRERQLWKNNMRNIVTMTDDFSSVSSFIRNHKYYERYCGDMCVELECHPGHKNYDSETNLLGKIPRLKRITYNEL